LESLTDLQIFALLAAVFAVAFFYSSVGHGGATRAVQKAGLHRD